MKPWKWTINTKLISIKSVYLINNNSSEDPCQHSWWLLLHPSIQTVSTGMLLLTSSQQLYVWPPSPVWCFYPILWITCSYQSQPRSTPGPFHAWFLCAFSRCNKELETLSASPTYPSGNSPTTKIINEHEIIHWDIKASLKCSKIRPSQYYCYYNKPPALSNFKYQFFFQNFSM